MLKSFEIKRYSFRLVFFIMMLDIVGVLAVSSATRGEARFVNRQIMGIIIGMIIAIIISIFPYVQMLKLSPYVYIACNILLVLVLYFGKNVGGATRWIVLPVIGQIQGSEFAKIGLIMFFPWFLHKYREYINQIPFLIAYAILAGIPLFLVVLEPDLSTTIVFIICILSMLFISGISLKWVFGSLAVVIPSAATFVWLLLNDKAPKFMKQYQINRILAWVNPEKYAELSRQQVNSIMAIGSGQLAGKGLNNTTLASVKNGNFLSEEQTDFIFAVIGEELGFVGCLIIIAIFALIVFECMYLASKAANLQGKLICTGFGTIIAFQSFTNIAVTTGIFPNTGLTLPFVSYGVSSLLSLHIGVGLLLSVSAYRK
jgi:hypothetical protein